MFISILVRFGLLNDHHLGKKLPTRLTLICSLCILYFLFVSHFDFDDCVWVLIGSFPGLCMLFFTFNDSSFTDGSRYLQVLQV